MPNRHLTPAELTIAREVLHEIRERLKTICGNDVALKWALRRKLAKELTYDERGKPMHRRALKMKKRAAQDNRCALCSQILPERGAVLDRIEAMLGYTETNTRLLCEKCDRNVQADRGYT